MDDRELLRNAAELIDKGEAERVRAAARAVGWRGRVRGMFKGALIALGLAVLLIISFEGSAFSIVLALLALPVGIVIGYRSGSANAAGGSEAL